MLRGFNEISGRNHGLDGNLLEKMGHKVDPNEVMWAKLATSSEIKQNKPIYL